MVVTYRTRVIDQEIALKAVSNSKYNYEVTQHVNPTNFPTISTETTILTKCDTRGN